MSAIKLHELLRRGKSIQKRAVEIEKEKKDLRDEVQVLLHRLGYLNLSGEDDFQEMAGEVVAKKSQQWKHETIWVEVKGIFLVEILNVPGSYRVGDKITFKADLTYLDKDFKPGGKGPLPVLGGRVRKVQHSSKKI